MIEEAEPLLFGPDGRPVRTIKVHKKQSEVLLSPARIKVCPWGRRSGKTENATLWSLAQAQRCRMERLRGVAWAVFPQYLHARAAWRKFMRLTPKGWITAAGGTEQQPGYLQFGGVRLEFRTAKDPAALVSEGLLFLWVDECGIVRERVWNESLRPALVDHVAPALLTGTPKGQNWFQEQYGKGWDPYFPGIASFGADATHGFSSYANPFVLRSEIDELAREMSERVYKQEILAEFLGREGAVFRRVRDQVMPAGNPEAWNETAKRAAAAYAAKFKGPPGKTIALGIDLARVQNFTVLIGLDQDFRQTHFERFREIDYPLQKARIRATYEALGKPLVVIDSTSGSVGDPIAQDLKRDGMRVIPFEFSGKTKSPMIEALVIGIEQGLVWLSDEPVLLNELETFESRELPGGAHRYAASEGKHDDCVMALGMAYWGARKHGSSGVSFAGARH